MINCSDSSVPVANKGPGLVLSGAVRFLFALVAVASPFLASAQSLRIDWFRIGGGGGASSGSNFTVIGSVGQYEAGSLAAGNFKLDGGFWPIAAAAGGGLPTITTQPQSEQVPLGTTATFTVLANSATTLSYQWFFNGTNLLAGATGAVLALTGVQPSDAGDYTVEVSNSFGTVTSIPAALVVLFPPSITKQPGSATVFPGAMVNFSVVASGSTPLMYQWRLNGVNLPGENGSSLNLLNAQVLNGGSYSVVVANAAGAITSDSVSLIVSVPPVPPGDNFVDRVGRVATNGAVSGTNLFATREPGEPNHAGQPGRRSVWYAWTAPASGVATFTTAGSTFDTLLAVYTGTVVSNLTAVASDDDSGGFFTSTVTFNAVAGTQFQIAIDGFGGTAGNYILSWTLLPGVQPAPVITSQPLSQTVVPGANVTFAVVANGAFYQWFFNGVPVSGATGPTLSLSKVRAADAGYYVVRVSNSSERSILSSAAFLELTRLPASLSQDKFEDLFVNFGSGGGPLAGADGKSPPGSAANGPGAVTAGTLNSQILNNTNSTTQAGEPNHCGVIGGASRWVKLTAGANGIFVIDTIGSTFDTVMAVYTGTNLLTLSLVTCDNNGAPDGIRSLVRFNATNGIDYLVAVDGVNGAQGTIQLNWGLGIPPAYTQPPSNVLAQLGSSITLNGQSASGVPTPSYQWLANGSIRLGANNSTMTLTNIQLGDAGPYSIALSNFVGSVTGVVANVTVVVPLDLVLTKVQTNGTTEFRLTGTASHGFVLQASTNLANWLPLFTNPTPGMPLNFLDVTSTNFPMRFYRAMPWP